jgi:hypothetical protein
LDGAAAPESGTTQTATTSRSDSRSKTPMINRYPYDRRYRPEHI